ncbi:hypothetical protein HanIR_Chr06g0268821 [Helianthus annuus]|nr:hypothetical protein HanIR_Chr06g0268821 [Helianthus annuus]
MVMLLEARGVSLLRPFSHSCPPSASFLVPPPLCRGVDLVRSSKKVMDYGGCVAEDGGGSGSGCELRR